MRDRLKHLIDDLGIDIILTEDEKQHIADYLINSGVIVPPCKVGDTLYDVTEFVEWRDCPDIYELQDNVIYVEKTKGGDILFSYDGVYIDCDAIGKTIFLTREEAEKALAERSENGKA